METKIFKQGLFAVIAALAINTTVSAQDSLGEPPLPPAAPKVYVFKENKAFKKNMADLKVKMQHLKKQMSKKNFNVNKEMKFAFKDFDKNFNASFKDFGKNFNESFKDFGKNFAGSFSEMAPEFSGGFKNFNGISYSNSNNLKDDEYSQKLASGEMIEKVKNYSKIYPADANDVLQISNSFGKIVVNTWAKNEFKVDVQMKFGATNEDYVNDMINGSGISDSKAGSVVSFRTNIYKGGNNRHGDNHMEINYTVYMPAGNALDITNKFGSVTLPSLSGKATINIQFGTLHAQQLSNDQNNVTLKFTQDNSSSITVFNGGKLRLDYSKLKVGVIDNVDADINFSGINVDRLKNSANVDIKYGDGFNVAVIDRAVKNINIKASFTKVNFDFKESQNFNFDVTTKMGSFNYDDDKAKVTAKTPSDEDRGWSSTKTYKGYIGKSNSDGKIVINSSFTAVRFE